MLSETKSLPETLSLGRISDLLRRFFLLIRMIHFCFLHLNWTITVSFFFQWDNALQTLLIRTSSSPTDAGTGFISSDSWWWYWALLTVFLSNWTIISLSKRLQFLLTVSPEERISYCLRKSLKRLVRSDSFFFFF